jgi:hypothetical protein
MSTRRMAAAIAGGLLLPCTPGCSFLERGPSDEEVAAAVRKSPPSPPTMGPSYLADVAQVEIRQRGRYSAKGRYWPVRVRVTGNVKIKITNPFQLGLVADAQKGSSEAVDFVEEARFTNDDYGNWRVSYAYDAASPRWRLDDSRTSHR